MSDPEEHFNIEEAVDLLGPVFERNDNEKQVKQQ